MARKYLKGGALNPIWCNEQDSKIFAESITSNIIDLMNVLDIDFNIKLGECVGINVSNKNKELKELCTVIDTESDYEAKFNFIKNHSATPEDLQLAKDIIGLK